MIAPLLRRAMCEAEETYHYYVNPAGGNDANPGTKAQPLQTGSAAITAIGATQGKSFGIKGGNTLRPSAPWAPVARTRIGKYGGGADPILSGGTLVTSWAQQLLSPFVQRFSDFISGTSAASYTFPVKAATTAGNTAILAIKCGAGAALNSVTDSKGNTWTVDRKSANVSGATVAIARGVMTTALTTADTITVNLSASASCGLAAYEYQWFAASPADQGAANSGSSTTATAGPTGTTTQATEVILSAVGAGTSFGAYTIPAGYTERASGQITAAVDMAELVVAATGAFTSTWTIPSGTWAVALQTYKLTASSLSNTYSAALTSAPAYVSSTLGGITTGLTLGSSPTTLTTNQYFWSSNTLYVNLAGVNPGTVTIEAATRQVINVGGSQTNGLVFRRLDFRHGADRMVRLGNASNFTVARCALRYCGYVANSGSLSIDGGGDGIGRITGCTFDHLQNDGVWWALTTGGIECDHNTFTAVGALAGDVQSDCIQIYTGFGVTGRAFWVHDNTSNMAGTFSPKGHITIVGPTGAQAPAGSVVERNMMTGGGTGVNCTTGNVTVRYNRATAQTGSSYSIGPSAQTIDTIAFYRNRAWDTHAGLTLYGPGGNTVTNLTAANNTFVRVTFAGVDIRPDSVTGTIANNVVTLAAGASFSFRYAPTGTGSALTVDRNDWGGGLLHYSGTTYTSDLAGFRAASGFDAHSTIADPQLDANDLPQAGSPARDAGLVLAGITDGYLGAAPDMGYAEVA